MESLAKVVTNTTSTSESDNLSEEGEICKEPEVREVRMVREMVEVAETFTGSVTRFCNAYHNEEAKMDKAKPTSKTLADMKTAYNNFVTAYAEQGNADEFFKGKNRVLHLQVFKKLQVIYDCNKGYSSSS